MSYTLAFEEDVMTLFEFSFLYVQEHDLAEGTANDYITVARIFSGWAKNAHFDGLEAATATELLNGWLEHLKHQGKSKDTIKGYRGKVMVLWRDAYRRGTAIAMPDAVRVKRIKVPKKNPLGWRRAEWMTLVSYCETAKPMKRKLRLIPVEKGLYLGSLFRFMRNTGMRLGDALEMEFASVQGGEVLWRQSKTGVWHRAILWPSTIEAIEKISQPKRRFIWGPSNRARRALYVSIKHAVRMAGLIGTTKFIRRGGATDAEHELPGSAPDYCGHVPGSRVAYTNYVNQEVLVRTVNIREA